MVSGNKNKNKNRRQLASHHRPRSTASPHTNGLGAPKATLIQGLETPAPTLTCNRASNSCLHPALPHRLVAPTGYPIPADCVSLIAQMIYSFSVFCLPPVPVFCLFPVAHPLLEVPFPEVCPHSTIHAGLLHGFHHLTDSVV